MESCIYGPWLGRAPVPQSGMDSKHYREGIRLFNQGSFFDAHEVLEDVWRAAPEGERKFLQGLIQVAVALHHHSKGNTAGAKSVLARASRNLSSYPERFGGIKLQEFRHSLVLWERALVENRPVPPHPKIQSLADSRSPPKC